MACVQNLSWPKRLFLSTLRTYVEVFLVFSVHTLEQNVYVVYTLLFNAVRSEVEKGAALCASVRAAHTRERSSMVRSSLIWSNLHVSMKAESHVI